MNRVLYLFLLVCLFVGCTAYIDNNTDPFIVAFSSDDPVRLRAYADIYDERAENIWRNSKHVRRKGSPIYDKYRRWAMLLNRKADMIESGEFENYN